MLLENINFLGLRKTIRRKRKRNKIKIKFILIIFFFIIAIGVILFYTKIFRHDKISTYSINKIIRKKNDNT